MKICSANLRNTTDGQDLRENFWDQLFKAEKNFLEKPHILQM